MTTDDPFTAIADELFALPAGDFTSARNARAKNLRSEDAELARRVQEVRKPSAAAWLVNQWVRNGRDGLDDLLELGRALRTAQDERDAGELTRLTRERRELVGKLVEQVRAVAMDKEVTASAANLDEASRTLVAATADEVAAAAVASGRLVRALEVVGFGTVDLDGAVAGEAAASPPPPIDLAARRRAKEERAGGEHATQSKKAQRDEEQKSRRRLAALDERATETRESLAEAEDALAALTARHDDLTAELEALDDRRREIEQELPGIRRSRRAATTERDRAARDAERAGRAADEARADRD